MSLNREQFEDAEANASISFHEVDNNLMKEETLELSDREEEYEKLLSVWCQLQAELKAYAYALRDI